MELIEIKGKIEELEEKEKLSNNELMRDIAHFCIVYPSEATEDKAFVDKQIAVISNASLAGDYAQNNLIDIRAYNQASGRN